MAHTQLRHILSVTSGATPSSGIDEYWDGDILWVTPKDVGTLDGYWLSATRRRITEAGYEASGTSMAPQGSIVLTKRAPIGQLAVLTEPACSNQGCVLLTPRGDQDSRYYYYWLLTQVEHLHALGRGSTFLELSIDDLKALRAPAPPLATQRAIADYLDRGTAEIDGLIATKERLLELQGEKRKALVASAVTLGLDPQAPVRKSGVGWLGQIPARWDVKRGKWLFRERDDRSDHGEGTLLSLRMERGLVPHNEVSEKQTRPDELIGYKRVSPGELVVNRMRASIGLIAIAPVEGLVSPDYAVFVAEPGTHMDYYSYLFTTDLLGSVFRSVSTGMGTGTQGFLRLYSESLLALWYPSPPEDEQRAIVSYIEQESAALTRLREATERTIGLLKERRVALIAAAVAGQIDVQVSA